MKIIFVISIREYQPDSIFIRLFFGWLSLTSQFDALGS